MPTTFNTIYLGQYASVDPFEGGFPPASQVAENPGVLLGTYDDFTNDDVWVLSAVSFNSLDDSGFRTNYNQNNFFNGTDTFRMTRPDGSQTFHGFDALVTYNATVTYADGTSASAVLAVFQDLAGNTWIAPPTSGGSSTTTVLAAMPISGVTLNSVDANAWAGMVADRFDITTLTTVVCFVAGTRIETRSGAVPVESLRAGMALRTLDRGPQKVKWVGGRRLLPIDLTGNPNLRPVRIRASAFAPGIPNADLLVSPQHRMLVRSRIAERMFGAHEVLVPAKHLVGVDGVEIDTSGGEVRYHHVMLAHHGIIFANNAPSESMFPGGEALKSVGPAANLELRALLPELSDPDCPPKPARPLINNKGRRLARRHIANGKPLLEAMTLA